MLGTRGSGRADANSSDVGSLDVADAMALVAHEFRSALGVIVGASATMTEHPELDGDTRAALLQAILDRGKDLTDLVDGMLDVGRLESGRLKIHAGAADVRGLVGGVVARIARDHPSVSFRVSVPDGSHPIMVDTDLIERVLGNLVSNAAKYSPPGGLIRVGARARAGDVVFDVVDDGPGIEPALREELFEKFSLLALGRGIGLGLYLCRRIVEAHGGRIWVSDDRDGFSVSFSVASTGGADG